MYDQILYFSIRDHETYTKLEHLSLHYLMFQTKSITMTMSFSTDFTITPLAGLFKHEPFSTPWGVYCQVAVISATMLTLLSHSKTAITAYSQVGERGAGWHNHYI